MNQTDANETPLGCAGRQHHRHHARGRRQRIGSWSPILAAACLALVASRIGGATWSSRRAWQRVVGR